MTLEVLVATMGQTDLSLRSKMNIGCDTVIANQCGKWSFDEETDGAYRVRMISSDTRGVGVNRNLALTLSCADIVLFADDDVTYYDSDLHGVLDAFRELPDADVIVFGLDMTRGGEVFDRRRCPVKRLHLYNALKYGAARMAVRRSALVKHNLTFSTLFGGGCIYGSGEDSLFLRNCFEAGLRVYSHSYVLGTCAKDSSSWFSGFNEKYMFDKGAWIAAAFPTAKHIIKWYFIAHFGKKSDLPTKTLIKNVNDGIRAYSSLTDFGGNSPER